MGGSGSTISAEFMLISRICVQANFSGQLSFNYLFFYDSLLELAEWIYRQELEKATSLPDHFNTDYG